jgi:hypothetical protein
MTEMTEQQQQGRVRGAILDGEEPKQLVLTDGSALAIDDETGSWRHGSDQLSVADALSMAGDENARYVKVRTRTEVEWLWMLAEWCQERAERLSGDLDRIAPAR